MSHPSAHERNEARTQDTGHARPGNTLRKDTDTTVTRADSVAHVCVSKVTAASVPVAATTEGAAWEVTAHRYRVFFGIRKHTTLSS